MLFNRHKPLYSQDDIAKHQAVIAELHKNKEKLLQQIMLSKNSKDRPQLEYENLEKTLTVLTGNIHTAELSLAHILQSNQKRYQRALQASK